MDDRNNKDFLDAISYATMDGILCGIEDGEEEKGDNDWYTNALRNEDDDSDWYTNALRNDDLRRLSEFIIQCNHNLKVENKDDEDEDDEDEDEDDGGESVVKNNEEAKYEYKFKFDSEKPKLSLVPSEIIYAIANIREYGNDKYGDVNGWRKVNWKRYIDAAYRHWLKVVEDPFCIDDESGYPHLWHVACNIAFLCSILDKDLKAEMETYIQNAKIKDDEDEDESDWYTNALRNDDLRRLSEFIRQCNHSFKNASNSIKEELNIYTLEDE